MELKFTHGRYIKVARPKGHERYEPMWAATLVADDTIVPGSAIVGWFYDATTFDENELREGPFASLEDAMDAARRLLPDMQEQDEDA
jgi:hypothetical protein